MRYFNLYCIAFALVQAFALAGCGNKDSVVFVTKTSLSILEADSKPSSVSIAYDRVEGYLGPKYDNGAVPPVYAAIESDGKLFNPKVNQLYATGNAARVASPDGEKYFQADAPDDLSGDKKLMFFGTSTTTGLKIGVTATMPDSFVFGYKRKEFSYIPLGTVVKDGEEIDTYPSVLAAIQTEGDVGESPLSGNVGLSNKQFFATGLAAESLANTLRPVFLEKAQSAVGNPALLAGCYSGVSYRLRPRVWQDASTKRLFFESDDEVGDTLDAFETAYKAALSGGSVDLDRLARVDSAYVHTMRFGDGLDDPGRNSRLAEHADFVCALAQLNES